MGKRILNTKWIVLIIILFILYPKFINFTLPGSMAALKVSWHILHRVMAIVFLALVFLMWKISPKAKPLYFSLIAYHACYFISNLVNKVNLDAHLLFFRNACWNIGVVVFMCSAIQVKPKMTLKLFRNVCLTMTVIHLLCLLVLPAGFASQITENTMFNTVAVAPVGFIAAKNRLSLFFIPAIFASIVYDKLYAKQERTPFLILMTMPIMLIEWSGTGIVAVFFFLLYIGFSKSEALQRVLTTKVAIIAYAGLYVMIVIMQNLSGFQYLIENILHKNMSLTGRISIWKYYIVMFIQKPIWGYGTGEEGVYYYEFGTRYFAHSQVLDILIQGGIVALAVFILVIFYGKRKIDAGKRYYYSGLANAALFSFLIMGIGEHFLMNLEVGFWVFLAFAFSCRDLFTIEVENKAISKGIHFKNMKISKSGL